MCVSDHPSLLPSTKTRMLMAIYSAERWISCPMRKLHRWWSQRHSLTWPCYDQSCEMHDPIFAAWKFLNRGNKLFLPDWWERKSVCLLLLLCSILFKKLIRYWREENHQFSTVNIITCQKNCKDHNKTAICACCEKLHVLFFVIETPIVQV